MNDHSATKSTLNPKLLEVLQDAASAVIVCTRLRLEELRVKIAAYNLDMAMPTSVCLDLLLEIVNDPVIFANDEAVENLSFMNQAFLLKLLGRSDDEDKESNPQDYFGEESNRGLCQMVIEAASRHFEESYLNAPKLIGDGPHWALLQAVTRWQEDEGAR